MNKETIEILEKLEKTADDFWNVSHQTGNFINMLIKLMGAKNVLELGTSNGYSGLWIAKALKQTGGKLTTIEFYDKRQSIAIENFKKCGVNDIIKPLQGSACEVIESFTPEEKFDFVFIDANKKEYIEYFELVDKMITSNGIILADNILSHYEKVENYVNLLFERKDYQSQILDLGTGMMLSRKEK